MIASANLFVDSSLGKFESHGRHDAPHRDILPWADPYIAQLIDDHAAELARQENNMRLVQLRGWRGPSRRTMAVAS